VVLRRKEVVAKGKSPVVGLLLVCQAGWGLTHNLGREVLVSLGADVRD